MATSSMRNHWGLLRRPLLTTDASIGRLDLLAISVTASILPLALWLLVVLLALPVPWLTGMGALKAANGVLAVLAISMAAGFLWPRSRFSGGSLLAAFITYARFKGNLVKLDYWNALAAAAASVFLVLRMALGLFVDIGRPPPPGPAWVVLVGLGCSVTASALLLRAMRSIPVIPRGATTSLAEYLDLQTTGADGLPGPRPAEPEADATFIYEFPVNSPEGHQVGVHVPPELLDMLRSINRDYEGRLYKQEEYGKTVAVVTGEEPPVDGKGVPELRRLGLQLCSHAVAAGWTPLRLANEILRFVQRHIEYVSDKESTLRLLGASYTEYGRFPLETLTDGEGDCECTALMCSALLAYAGLSNHVLFVSFEEDGEEHYHAAVGLRVNARDFPLQSRIEPSKAYVEHNGELVLYGETTSDGEVEEGFGTIPACWRTNFKVRQAIGIKART